MFLANQLETLRYFYGKGIHLYSQAVIYQQWFLIPIDWGNGFYTVCCFDPSGCQSNHWQNSTSIEDAIASGRELADRIILKMGAIGGVSEDLN